MAMSTTRGKIGAHLREWRRRRRYSQLDLAQAAEISPRHLGFLETGRAQPSREMVLRLAECLELPSRDRNQMLLATGFAPIFPERKLEDPALAAANDAVRQILERHAPYPAYALDRHWNVVATNRALPELYEGVASDLLTPPVNVVRLSLHPDGLAPRVLNLAEWRAHVIGRLRRQIELTGDPALVALANEARRYAAPMSEDLHSDVIVQLRIRTRLGALSLLTTTMVFGGPVDITLSELALELFFPADAATDEAVRRAGILPRT
jgi:transcriptional regulator with XRE-family HTH domain